MLKLPRRAVVAFAARCARLVQPLYALPGPQGEEHAKAVDRAIRVAEDWASGQDVADAAARAALAAQEADDAAADAYVARVAARSAAFAAQAAAEAELEASDSAVDASFAASSAEEAALRAGDAAALAAIQRDHELLRESAVRERWTDETPVPPGFFGPLWQQGK